MGKVWVTWNGGLQTQVKVDDDANVDDLRDAFVEKLPEKIVAAEIKVYTNTTDAASGAEPLNPRYPVKEFFGNAESLVLKWASKTTGLKRSGSSGEVDAVKRVCLNPDDASQLGSFIKILAEGSLGDGFIKFATTLFGGVDTSNIVYIRKCYPMLYSRSFDYLNSSGVKKHKPAVTIMGTPGIGKTVCGVYHAWRLLKEENATILYSYNTVPGAELGNVFLLAPKDTIVLQAARDAGFEVPTVQSSKFVGRILVGEKPGRELVEFLEDHADVYYIVDPPKAGILIEPQTRSKKLVFSSPHRGASNSLANNSLSLYMPTWEKAELAEAIEKMGLPVTADELTDRFARFDGIARWVLAQDFTPAISFYDAHIGDLTAQSATDILNPFGGNKDVSSLFVHMVPSNSFAKYSVRISSQVVRQYLAVQVAMSGNWTMQTWASTASRAGLSVAGGDLLEQAWHNAFALGGRLVENCSLKVLDTDATKKVNLPNFGVAALFANNDMSDLDELKLGQYCLPLNRNLETVDSFVVTRKPFIDEENADLCLVGFQMTIAKEHPMKQAGMVRLMNKVESLFAAELKGEKLKGTCVYMVFVTEEKNVPKFKKQSWKKGDGDPATKLQDKRLSEVRQFVVGIQDKLMKSKGGFAALRSVCVYSNNIIFVTFFYLCIIWKINLTTS
eukprot:Lithocolla_globosa_v1_NODE_6_length_11976_cov_15.425432.p1 type:complete len:672 gc:universal NODE_6_length_11976_cov_15.425432:4516-2501(-)